MNASAWLEFELANFEIAAEQFNHGDSFYNEKRYMMWRQMREEVG